MKKCKSFIQKGERKRIMFVCFARAREWLQSIIKDNYIILPFFCSCCSFLQQQQQQFLFLLLCRNPKKKRRSNLAQTRTDDFSLGVHWEPAHGTLGAAPVDCERKKEGRHATHSRYRVYQCFRQNLAEKKQDILYHFCLLLTVVKLTKV